VVVLRALGIAVLALVAAVNVIGFLFLAFGWWMGADMHVKGGPLPIAFGGLALWLCLSGIRVLARPRPTVAA
jgi:hypothetical protein